MKGAPTAATQHRVDADYDQAAAGYEAQPGHDIAADESAAWQADLSRAGVNLSPHSVLDVGTGTGVFARWWAARGALVTGLDPSEGMLQVARWHPHPAGATAPRYLFGHAEHTGSYPDGRFDLICSRQAACYFADPIAVFALWRDRLASGGQVLVVDGLWPRSGFGDAELVDALPLSCVHTLGTWAYLLRCAGFRRVHTHWLQEVNARHRVADGTPGARFFAVADAV